MATQDTIDRAHKLATEMDAVLEDLQWWSTPALADLGRNATAYTGPDSSGWNGIILDRVAELLSA